MNQMNPEVKQAWLSALRSGEYSQTRQNLHTPEGHCCLGVLCEISSQGSWGELSKDDFGDGFYRYHVEDQFAKGMPPEQVQEWAKLNPMTELPREKYAPYVSQEVLDNLDDCGQSAASLAALNDNGATFEEIADVVEHNF